MVSPRERSIQRHGVQEPEPKDESRKDGETWDKASGEALEKFEKHKWWNIPHPW